jgi:prolyl oligopeptidase
MTRAAQPETDAAEKAADNVTPAARLLKLYDAEWQISLAEDPIGATYTGDTKSNSFWPDQSLAAIERRHRHKISVLKQLEEIDASQLQGQDRINYQLFRKRYEEDVAGHQYKGYLIPLDHRDGIQTMEQLAEVIDFEKIKDYEDWITRLRTFDRMMDETLDLLKGGVKAGMVHSRIVAQRIPNQIKQHILKDPTASLYYMPFRKMTDSIPEAEQKRLQAEAQDAIATVIVPSYEKMLKFFEETYLPACYEQVGIWQAPHGQEYYAHLARHFTTTDMTPDQIHEIGLKEVARIHQEMEAIIEQVGFKGTFQEFLTFLRTDPQFYFKTQEELLEASQVACKKIDPQLIKLFKTLPRTPYGVQAIPANIAPDTTAAYYRPPDAKGTRPGMYFVNLYKPETRPKYEIEALTLHESVPGHHLQIALANELDELPMFRSQWGYTAFIEGWGLYSESLGPELGCYKDPYSKFGQLTYEMWRAVRLVVDTGMHSKKWTRQQAIEFFAKNAAKSMHDIEVEIDRYIAWPGQALAYKIGELKIRELRTRAETELGDKFDIREFHDAVLKNGAVSLQVLEDVIDQWIAEQKKNTTAS